MTVGVAGISAKGMYSGQDKLMLFCVVGKKELVHLKEMIDEIDPNAFVIVGDARERSMAKDSSKNSKNKQKVVKKLCFPLLFLVILY